MNDMGMNDMGMPTSPATPQSWNDFALMPPTDPRFVIQKVTFDDNTGSAKLATFARVTDWLQNVTWVDPVVKFSDVTTSTTPFITANSPQDFQSVQEALIWNSTHAMVTPNTKLPLAVKKIVFAKSGMSIDNTLFIDFIGGKTSTNVELSFRDNSLTSGNLDPTGTVPTIPVFQFPSTATYGGTSRKLTFTTIRPGRYALGIRVVDNLGNYSMFEINLNILP